MVDIRICCNLELYANQFGCEQVISLPCPKIKESRPWMAGLNRANTRRNVS